MWTFAITPLLQCFFPISVMLQLHRSRLRHIYVERWFYVNLYFRCQNFTAWRLLWVHTSCVTLSVSQLGTYDTQMSRCRYICFNLLELIWWCQVNAVNMSFGSVAFEWSERSSSIEPKLVEEVSTIDALTSTFFFKKWPLIRRRFTFLSYSSVSPTTTSN